MATMLETKTLRFEPNGARMVFTAVKGTDVTILESPPPGEWTKIRLVSDPDEPEGWVPTSAIDPTGVAAAPAQIDHKAFATECLLNALYFGVTAHYLLAVAELRSGISPGNQAPDMGPFRLR